MLDHSTTAENEDYAHDNMTLSLARSSRSVLDSISNQYVTYSRAKDHHALFAHLYYHSTLQWLDHLKGKQDVHFLYLLIEKFYALYDHHVTQVVEGKRTQVAQHWQPYFTMVRRLDASHNSLTMLRVARTGARAHVRYDLADAIICAALDYKKRYGALPDLSQARQLHMEAATSKIFERAMFNFTIGETAHMERQLAGDALLMKHSARLGHLWRPMLHWWRTRAWQDAVQFLSEDTADDARLLYCGQLDLTSALRHPH